MAWGKNKGDSEQEFDAVHAAEELGDLTDKPARLDEYVATLESEIESLNNLLAQKDAQLARISAQNDEQLDEIERIKKRLTGEAQQEVEKGVGKVLSELLELGDDLGRAIQSAREMDHNPAVVEGIELVRQRFGSKLQKLGVTRMEAQGAPFDPNIHEAISMMPVSDPAQDGQIVSVVQEGYHWNGKVLREARVAVGKLAQ